MFMNSLLKRSIFYFTLIVISSLTWSESSYALSFHSFAQSFPLEIEKDNGVAICSSVAISPLIILTAAHCVEGALKISLVKGFSLDENHERFVALEWESHPKYDDSISNYHFDIARIRLKNPLASTVPFSKVGSALQDGAMVRVGFGAREGMNKRTLIYGQKILFQDDLYLELDDHYGVMGDSGGPVFQLQNGSYKLIGIHSTRQGEHVTYAVHTQSVSEFVDYL